MQKFQSNSKSQHKRKNNENPSSKRQRLELPDEQPTVVSTTKIINLNDDCLVKIFELLDFNSLFNVAIANEWLRHAAGTVYKRKCGTKCVKIEACNDFRPPNTRARARNPWNGSWPLCSQLADRSVFIYGLKTSLQFLRCFGSSISNLLIDYNKSTSKRYQYVHLYVNRYCIDSLTEIAFRRKPSILIKNLIGPFVNVKSVMFWYINLAQQLPSFAKWFPNVQNLNIYYVPSFDRRFIDAHFPHLENLLLSHYLLDDFVKRNVTAFLPSNRQLRTFEISGWSDSPIQIGKLLDMIKDNPLISKLRINTSRRTYNPRRSEVESAVVKSVDVQRLVKEHSSLVELELPGYQFSGGDAIKLIRRLKFLKKFCFRIKHHDYTKFESKLDAGWHTYKFADDVTLNRKNLNVQLNL